MKKIIIILVLIIILGAGGYLAYGALQANQAAKITTFADCVAAGYPVMESYPPQCLTPDGRTLVDETATSTAVTLDNGTYNFMTASSSIIWEGRKKLVEGYVDRGNIKLKTGELNVTGGQITGGQIIIDMSSIAVESTSKVDGETAKLATHLKSDDFFGVTKYPTATFKLKTATPDPTGENKYILEGDLTIRDTTNMISIPVTLGQKDGQLTLTGEAIVNRAKFNVKYGSESFFKDLGDKVIEDDFKLIFSIVASK